LRAVPAVRAVPQAIVERAATVVRLVWAAAKQIPEQTATAAIVVQVASAAMALKVVTV
jgi:hypothetical protein